jgi:hypothetical protein
MKPKMSAAQLEARRKAGLSTSIPTHACSGALRTPNQTAKRSVHSLHVAPRSANRPPQRPESELANKAFYQFFGIVLVSF